MPSAPSRRSSLRRSARCRPHPITPPITARTHPITHPVTPRHTPYHTPHHTLCRPRRPACWPRLRGRALGGPSCPAPPLLFMPGTTLAQAGVRRADLLDSWPTASAGAAAGPPGTAAGDDPPPLSVEGAEALAGGVFSAWDAALRVPRNAASRLRCHESRGAVVTAAAAVRRRRAELLIELRAAAAEAVIAIGSLPPKVPPPPPGRWLVRSPPPPPLHRPSL